ncbi:DUF1206 domain-containing protein [Telluribacter humicola]|uniref:DUF1206 domain-containing protein n=1 Tax=Telluribacter humicola TaxID=1720261 RepID=UPI001A96D362|nr:DUF1206 domain-containing protein [Telluribacter humicola]
MAYTLTHRSQDKWIETAARVGLTAKGVVYSLVGILTFAAAFELGGSSGSSSSQGSKMQILQWIQNQPFGQILLGLIAFGLLCYAIWRIIEAVRDTERKGDDSKGLAIRAAFFTSGLLYGALAFFAGRMLFGNSGGSGGNSRQTLVQKLLEQPFGQWLVGIVALVIIGIGLYQIYRAISGKYREKVQRARLDSEVKETLIKTGKAGYIARGIVWSIIGYLFLQAAMQSDSSEVGGTSSAFSFLEKNYGSWILGVVALGLLCYGIFMFLRARYQPIHTR